MHVYKKSNIKTVKVDSGKNRATYAVEVDGKRLDNLRIFVERVYRNSKIHGKGFTTQARVVDVALLRKLIAEGWSLEQREKATTLADTSSLKYAVACLEKKLHAGE